MPGDYRLRCQCKLRRSKNDVYIFILQTKKRYIPEVSDSQQWHKSEKILEETNKAAKTTGCFDATNNSQQSKPLENETHQGLKVD